jgi:hypothetical protein
MGLNDPQLLSLNRCSNDKAFKTTKLLKRSAPARLRTPKSTPTKPNVKTTVYQTREPTQSSNAGGRNSNDERTMSLNYKKIRFLN